MAMATATATADIDTLERLIGEQFPDGPADALIEALEASTLAACDDLGIETIPAASAKQRAELHRRVSRVMTGLGLRIETQMHRLHPLTGRSRTCVAAALSILLGIPTDEVIAAWRGFTRRQRCRGIAAEDVVILIYALGFWPKTQTGLTTAGALAAARPDGRFVLLMRDRPHAVAMAGGKLQDNGSYYPDPLPVDCLPICDAIEVGARREGAGARERESRS